MQASIYIGTSGWSYKHWKNDLYPASLPATEYLPYYSQFFSITEINSSFYNLPEAETFVNWLKKVPADFLFCPKLNRYITHFKKLHDSNEALHRFFQVFNMPERLGPVLIQLPPFLTFNATTVQSFYKLLGQYPGYYAIEARHTSWLQPESIALMQQHNIALVIAQSGGIFPYSEKITSGHIYLRMHGPQQLYASAYTDDELTTYAQKMQQWAKTGHTVWVFFNNDVNGYAYKNAIRLKEILGQN